MNDYDLDFEKVPAPTFAELFQGLRPVRAWRLAGPEVAPIIQTHSDRLELEWLERHGIHTVADLLAIGPDDISMWNGFGVTKIERLSAFVQRLDAASTDLLVMRMQALEEKQSKPTGPALLVSDAVHDLSSLAEWARFSSGAATVGDLVRALASGDGPHDVLEMSRIVQDTPLPAVGLDPLGDLRAWIASLDDRYRAILEQRLVRFEEATLDDIGAEFEVTRERIRQLETKLKMRLRGWVDSDDGRSVRWALHLLSRGVGACAPDSEVPLVGDDGGHSTEFGLLLYLADIVWDRERHLIRRRGFVWPKAEEVPLVDGGPVIDEPEVRALLQSHGVVADHVDWAVGEIHGIRRLDGILVVWPANMVDQGLAVLTVVGEPMTDAEIAERLERDINVRGLRNRLMDDSRITRVTKNEFALASSGLPEYGGIVASMVQALEESGPTTVADLARHLADRHAIKAGSVAAYAAAPIFIRDGDLLRLRRADEPYSPALDVSAVRGLFRLGPRKFAWHVPVDNDVLRGSGRFFPAEAATAIGVYPGRSEVLANPVREVRITWTATTHMGPSISSLRSQAEAVGAVQGDRLCIVIDGGGRTAEVSLAPPRIDDVAALAQLLDLDPGAVSTERLARAVDVAPEDVDSTLRRRGEADIADVVAAALHAGAAT